jgi:Na+/melibiose symporter-like transporter
VQAVGAPLTILVDALCAFTSALLLVGLKSDEPKPAPAPHEDGWFAQLKAGLRFIWHSRTLRFLLLQRVVWTILFQTAGAMQMLYAVKTLGLSPAFIGAGFLMGGFGGLAGAAVAERLGHGTGVARGSTFGVGVMAASLVVLVASNAVGVPAFLCFSAFLALFGFGMTFHNVHFMALRAQVTPAPLQGRVFTVMLFASYLLTPAFVLLAGAWGERFGVGALLLVLGAMGALTMAVSGALAPSEVTPAASQVAGHGS